MKWTLVVAAIALHGSLCGQSPVPNGETKPPKETARTDQRAQSMRDQIGSGRAVHSHVRVAVRLKNGNKLIGVVKDGRLVERVDGLRFVDAQALERGAGIRLWYSGGARNYVFVPFTDFAEYEVLEQLTQKQLQLLESEMQMEERRAAERVAAAGRQATGAAAVPPVVEGEVAPPTEPVPSPVVAGPMVGKNTKKAAAAEKAAADSANTAAKAEQELQKAWFALVQDYPPAGGWNAQKRDEIKRRLVVIGSKPSAAEQRFADNFEQWQKACAHFGVEAKKALVEGEPVEGEESTDTRRNRRKQ